MTFREFDFWLRAARVECRRSPVRWMIPFVLVSCVLSWELQAFIYGTQNPLLLNNPNFHPSLFVRASSLLIIVALCIVTVSVVYLVTLKSQARMRLGLDASSIYLPPPPPVDASFFDLGSPQ